MNTIDEIKFYLDEATYAEVFTAKPGISSEKRFKTLYLRWVRGTHPDRFTDPVEKETAEKAFQRLNELYEEAKESLTGPVKPKPSPVKENIRSVKTNKNEYFIDRDGPNGDVCSTFFSKDGYFLKVAKNPADNDLLDSEAKALNTIAKSSCNFVQKLVEDSTLQDGRRVNVVSSLEDDWISLKTLKEKFPSGLDVRHVVWIWRKLLVAMNAAHANGIYHCAVTPDNIMIKPSQHGLIIVDWCFSRDSLKGSFALASEYASWYAKDFTGKKYLSGALDIIMGARVMVYLLGGDPENPTALYKVHPMISAFFAGCISNSQRLVPGDSLAILEEFDELLERIGAPFYPRRFVELTV